MIGRLAWLAVVLLVLAGCGGAGGDDNEQLPSGTLPDGPECQTLETHLSWWPEAVDLATRTGQDLNGDGRDELFLDIQADCGTAGCGLLVLQECATPGTYRLLLEATQFGFSFPGSSTGGWQDIVLTHSTDEGAESTYYEVPYAWSSAGYVRQ